jgi:hypothetical protein
MAIVKLNRRRYVSAIHGRGLYGRYHRVLLPQGGHGIIDSLGKEASKYILGGIGKSSGAYAGKALGKLIQDKTGSQLLGKVAKAGLSSLGGLAGQNLGHLSGKLLGNTVFSNKEQEDKKKKKAAPGVSLSSLLDQARSKVMPGSSSGSGLMYQ